MRKEEEVILQSKYNGALNCKSAGFVVLACAPMLQAHHILSSSPGRGGR